MISDLYGSLVGGSARGDILILWSTVTNILTWKRQTTGKRFKKRVKELTLPHQEQFSSAYAKLMLNHEKVLYTHLKTGTEIIGFFFFFSRRIFLFPKVRNKNN